MTFMSIRTTHYVKGVFEDFVHHFLKGERFCFKNLFTKKGQQICPLGIEPPQWEHLMKY
jgi:hypothetical protein